MTSISGIETWFWNVILPVTLMVLFIGIVYLYFYLKNYKRKRK